MIKVPLVSHLFLIICVIATAVTDAFVGYPTLNKRAHHVEIFMAKEDGDSKSGYRFGDLTRGLLKKVQEDSSSSGYKFGDISRWLDKKAKEQVSKFTKKENYQFGDMSKEVIRRLKDGEYTRDDLWLFLRIVATIGINLQPVTSVLPLKVLMQLLNMTMEASIAQTVGDKVVSALTNEIEGRVKELVTGDSNYELGDFTKRALSNWTGKETYEFGDVTRTMLAKRAEARDSESSGGDDKDGTLELFSSKSEEELLEEWDKKLLNDRQQKAGSVGGKDDESYKDWDEKFFSSSPT